MENSGRQPELLIEKRRRTFQPFWTALYIILLAVIVILAGRLYVVNRYFLVTVFQDSMRETLHNGDAVYATRDVDTARRGDIVVVDVKDVAEFGDVPSDDSGQHIIKRLIAVGGDKLKCEHGKLMLDTGDGYRELDEPYLSENVRTLDFAEVVLKADEIFVMGDNRGGSADSRRLALNGSPALKRERLMGVVLAWSIPGSGGSGGVEEFFIKGFIEGFF